MSAATEAPARAKRTSARAGFDRGAFYRLCRMLHAYLSAFAFLALIFFAATGLLLNHPDWWQGAKPRERELTTRLPAAELSQALAAREPPRALAAAARRRLRLLGAFKDGSVEDGDAVLRLEGAKGTTDLDVDTRSGAVHATVQPATAANIIEELHRGRASGAAWRWVIDVSAVLVLALSLIGYVLFFSLRFRLRTSLVLTAISLGALLLIYLVAVP